MDNVIKLLVEAAEDLDSCGLKSIADKVDKLANKTLDIKTAQYVGIQGYAVRNSRCWGNCYRQKRASNPSKSAQQVWVECHKEYIDSLNNDGSKWDKYAGDQSKIKIGSEMYLYLQKTNKKIANKVDDKISEGLDIGSAVYSSIEEVANESSDSLILASNEALDIASKLFSKPKIAEKLTKAAEEMVREAGFMDFFRGVGQGVSNFSSNINYTGQLKSMVTNMSNNYQQMSNAKASFNSYYQQFISNVNSVRKDLDSVRKDSNSTPQQKQQSEAALQALSGMLSAKSFKDLEKSWPNTLNSLQSVLRGNFGANNSSNGQPNNAQTGNVQPPNASINPSPSTNSLGGMNGSSFGNTSNITGNFGPSETTMTQPPYQPSSSFINSPDSSGNSNSQAPAAPATVNKAVPSKKRGPGGRFAPKGNAGAKV